MSHALRRFAVSVVAAVVPVAAVVAPAGGDPRPWYVALGDSYSSGVGAEPYPPGACQRSDGAYAPRFTRSSAGAGYDLVFVACSGAETRHVVSEGQREAGVRHPQIQKVRDLAEFVRLVTITIGGNDARFGEILHACVTGFRSCTVTYGPGGERGDQGEWIERVVRPRLVQTYRALRDAAPDDRVVVLTYPQIFQGQRDCGRDAGIDRGEKEWIRAQTTHLNNVINTEARRAGLDVVDVEGAVDKHEICTADPYAAGINEPGTFHPNAKGYERMARTLQDALS